MSGIIYFIQPATLVGSIPSRYKIGMSSKNNLKRCNSYGDGSRFICIMESNNPNFVENKLKEEFNKKFKLCAGNEYFEGNETEMLYSFLEIMNKYNNVGFIDKDVEYKKNVYEKDEIVSDLILINKKTDEEYEEDANDNLKYVILKDLFEYLCNVYNKNIKLFEYEICDGAEIDKIEELTDWRLSDTTTWRLSKVFIKKKINCNDEIIKYQTEINNIFDEFIYNIKIKYENELYDYAEIECSCYEMDNDCDCIKIDKAKINNIISYFVLNKKNIIDTININYCNDDKINNFLQQKYNSWYFHHRCYKEMDKIINSSDFNIDNLNNIYCEQYNVINMLYSNYHNINSDMLDITMCYFLGCYDEKYEFLTKKHINKYIEVVKEKYNFILLKEIDDKYSGFITKKNIKKEYNSLILISNADTNKKYDYYLFCNTCPYENMCSLISKTFEGYLYDLVKFNFTNNISIYSLYSNEQYTYKLYETIQKNIIKNCIKTKINDEMLETINIKKYIDKELFEEIDNILKEQKCNVKYKNLLSCLRKIKKEYKYLI